jgi:hypothetical protein
LELAVLALTALILFLATLFLLVEAGPRQMLSVRLGARVAVAPRLPRVNSLVALVLTAKGSLAGRGRALAVWALPVVAVVALVRLEKTVPRLVKTVALVAMVSLRLLQGLACFVPVVGVRIMTLAVLAVEGILNKTARLILAGVRAELTLLKTAGPVLSF